MDIFLLILKIIGIILLSILGLILFVLIVLLITPFRYSLSGLYKDKKPDVLLNIHFWLHLISLKVCYNDSGLSGTLRIFFIKKRFLSKPKKEASDEAIGEDELQEFVAQLEEDDGLSSESPEEQTAEEKNEADTQTDSVQNEEDKSEEKAEESTPEDNTEENEESEQSEEDKSFVDRIADKLRGLYDKVVGLVEKLQRKWSAIEWLLGLESTKRLIRVAIRQIIKTLKSILPKKLKGNLVLGLDNPQVMGMICTYTSVIYPSFPKKFEFTPVFNEKIIDGEGEIKGRIILGAVLGHLLKIVIRRDFFRTLKNLKRFKKLWR